MNFLRGTFLAKKGQPKNVVSKNGAPKALKLSSKFQNSLPSVLSANWKCELTKSGAGANNQSFNTQSFGQKIFSLNLDQNQISALNFVQFLLLLSSFLKIR
eukprot:TRINITY_DN8515_c0_g1_i1.p1 TRINITY_DN8515_c0_g1~~TRINITY_DN8515_c0_g1_i1.p1  ORF type:complete len:101 (-),score=20.93 TRINITY_DN8515_c0_g1_i1:205-507(-)